MHATNPGQRPPHMQHQQQQQPQAQQPQQQQAAHQQQAPPPLAAAGAAPQAQPAAPAPDEVTSLRATLKGKKEWLRSIETISAANPTDSFATRILTDLNAEISDISAKLDALRPPEARMSQ